MGKLMIDNAMLGTSEVNKIYLGNEVVYEKESVWWIGEGSKKCLFTLFWNDNLESTSVKDGLTWGFRWDGDKTLNDLIEALVEEDKVYTPGNLPRIIFLRQYRGVYGTIFAGVGYGKRNFGRNITFDLEGARKAGNSYPENAQEIADNAIYEGRETGIIEHPFNATGSEYVALDYDYWIKDSNEGSHWSAGVFDGAWLPWEKKIGDKEWMRSGTFEAQVDAVSYPITGLDGTLKDGYHIALNFVPDINSTGPFVTPPSEINYAHK